MQKKKQTKSKKYKKKGQKKVYYFSYLYSKPKLIKEKFYTNKEKVWH